MATSSSTPSVLSADARPCTILAICGSLRAGSSNAKLLELVAAIAPTTMTVVAFREIDRLPHFNPDIDREEDVPPEAVTSWRAAVAAADGVVISSPEYAHGVPGAFKNALDWLVSSGDFLDKPTVLLNAAHAGGEFAQASLAETLRLIGANVLEAHSRTTPFLPAGIWRDGPDQLSMDAIRTSLDGLAVSIACRYSERPGS